MDLTLSIQAIEQEMHRLLPTPPETLAPFYGMMAYHLGWVDRAFRPTLGAGGKRIRPLLCLLTAQALGEEGERVLPATAAIELIHNFSLIHDDIEDASPTRRHRETVWNIWGVPQAVNAGDGMLMLAHLALLPLVERGVPAERVLEVARILDTTCLRLCQGQYLDIAFEDRLDITVEQYLEMIGGKTASLIAASTEIGALLATEERGVIASYRTFGWEMGLAFQMVDDILGIWGDPATTGKSAASDITSRKKTLPILYALARLEEAGSSRNGRTLRDLYQQPELSEADVSHVLDLLDEMGARADVEARAAAHTSRALAALDAVGLDNPAQAQLREIAGSFLKRTF